MPGSLPSRSSLVKNGAKAKFDTKRKMAKKSIFHAVAGSVNAFLGCSKTEDTRPLAPMTSPDHSKRTAALRPIIEEKTEKVRGRKKINKNYNTSRATKANYQI